MKSARMSTLQLPVDQLREVYLLSGPHAKGNFRVTDIQRTGQNGISAKPSPPFVPALQLLYTSIEKSTL